MAEKKCGGGGGGGGCGACCCCVCIDCLLRVIDALVGKGVAADHAADLAVQLMCCPPDKCE
jgi:hypothetical protein